MTSEGMKIATSTVLNYVEYFKEAFILFNVSRYDIKGKNLVEDMKYRLENWMIMKSISFVTEVTKKCIYRLHIW